jgi:hypothetical protein
MTYRLVARHRLAPTPVVLSFSTSAEANARAAEIVNAIREAEGLPEIATAETWRAALGEVAVIYAGEVAGERPVVAVDER